MKSSIFVFAGAASIAVASLAFVGCAGDGAVGVGVGVDTGPYYGGYYNDGAWVYGHPYYHDQAHFAAPAGGGFRGGWGHAGGGGHPAAAAAHGGGGGGGGHGGGGGSHR